MRAMPLRFVELDGSALFAPYATLERMKDAVRTAARNEAERHEDFCALTMTMSELYFIEKMYIFSWNELQIVARRLRRIINGDAQLKRAAKVQDATIWTTKYNDLINHDLLLWKAIRQCAAFPLTRYRLLNRPKFVQLMFLQNLQALQILRVTMDDSDTVYVRCPFTSREDIAALIDVWNRHTSLPAVTTAGCVWHYSARGLEDSVFHAARMVVNILQEIRDDVDSENVENAEDAEDASEPTAAA